MYELQMHDVFEGWSSIVSSDSPIMLIERMENIATKCTPGIKLRVVFTKVEFDIIKQITAGEDGAA